MQPTESTLQTCEESGTDLAQEVKKAILKQKRASGAGSYVAASNVEQVLSIPQWKSSFKYKYSPYWSWAFLQICRQ